MPIKDTKTVHGLVAAGRDDATAISAPGRADLTYRGLRDHIAETIAALNRMDIGKGDRLAIVLPNGPEMATAFVAIAAAATTAPLNPGYRRPEFEFYLADLRARALVVPEGSDSPAVEAARHLGVEVLAIRPRRAGPAGLWSFADDGTSTRQAARPGPAQSDDEALVLHTSGTTSRPKIVPLLHSNVCASAASIRSTLVLTPSDRCMNVMPLFHIHGLMACVLSPLASGGSVFCTPGFDAMRFFSWLAEARPTWYSAVPTMHQAILSRASSNPEALAETTLRFIRSSSASLPPQVMADLESVFDTAVVEAYAMTEAAHQMTCNPLPPAMRKPGTVGPAAGPEVSVMSDDGNLLPRGHTGEIVIRGENVTPGYENNDDANREAFSNGWFRTGDLGTIDDDGYVTISGRLKEIINRGGEKISPREVDEVLLAHPDVQQAVTFAMPHAMLGEEVAAAVVLTAGRDTSAAEIREFAAERIAGFKVPRKVIVLDEIPTGPTGKLRRIGLADQLGLG